MSSVQRVHHFSAGESSAMMVLENYRSGDMVIFCDTGREVKGTYIFLDEFEKHEGIPIIRLSYPGGFRAMLVRRKAIPNIERRICTIELKIKTARRYLRSIGLTSYIQFIGFRHDEPARIKDYKHIWKKVTTLFPLADSGINTAGVEEYWAQKRYRLNIPKALKNCDGCFMKGINLLMAIYQQDPSRADPWIEDEEAIGYTYIKGISHKEIRDRALTLKKMYDIEKMTPKYSCHCGV